MSLRETHYSRDQRKSNELLSVTTHLREFIEVGSALDDVRTDVAFPFFDTFTSSMLNFQQATSSKRRAERYEALEVNGESVAELTEQSETYNERGLYQLQECRERLSEFVTELNDSDRGDIFQTEPFLTELGVFQGTYRNFLADIDIKPEDAAYIDHELMSLTDPEAVSIDVFHDFIEEHLDQIEEQRQSTLRLTKNFDPFIGGMALILVGMAAWGLAVSTQQETTNAEQLAEAAAEASGAAFESQD